MPESNVNLRNISTLLVIISMMAGFVIWLANTHFIANANTDKIECLGENIKEINQTVNAIQQAVVELRSDIRHSGMRQDSIDKKLDYLVKNIRVSNANTN